MVRSDSQISIPTLNYVVYTCRLHVDDMFGEMLGMASMGLVMVLSILLFFHHCFPIFLMISSYHSIMAKGPGFGPKKVA